MSFLPSGARKAKLLSRGLLPEYRAQMLEKELAPSTINVRCPRSGDSLAKPPQRMDRCGAAAEVTGILNVRQQGTRKGNWLTLGRKSCYAFPTVQLSRASAIT